MTDKEALLQIEEMLWHLSIVCNNGGSHLINDPILWGAILNFSKEYAKQCKDAKQHLQDIIKADEKDGLYDE